MRERQVPANARIGWRPRGGFVRCTAAAAAVVSLVLLSGTPLSPQGSPVPVSSGDLYLVPEALIERIPEAVPVHRYPGSVLASVPDVGRLPRRVSSRLTSARDATRVGYRAFEGPVPLSSPADVESLPDGYYLVAFTGPIDPVWKASLESGGLRIVDAATPYAVVVRGSGDGLAAALSLSTSFGYRAVRGVLSVPIEARVAPDLLRLARGQLTADQIRGLRRDAAGLAAVRVATYSDQSLPDVARRVARVAEPAADALAAGPSAENDVFLVRAAEILIILSTLPEVAYIEAVHERERDDNLAAKDYILNVEPVWSSRGYNGAGVIVDHNDSGIDLAHPDFPPGVVLATMGAMSGTDNGHGTHTAGSVVGRGLAAISPVNDFMCGDQTTPLATVRGMAWGAQLVSNNLFDGGLTTEASMMLWGYQQGARISTNSWSYVSLYDYTSQSATVDRIVRDVDLGSPGNQQLFVFFSSGNDGPAAQTTKTPSNAKNVVTVGASQNDRCARYIPANCPGPNINAVACFSSRGPAQGRVKPDLVAVGTEVLSAQSADPLATNGWDQSWTGPEYATNDGTSMSTPLAAGAGAVFFEFYQATFGSFPSPALAKAALINGATDMGLGYPSYAQGWGRLNLRRSIEGPPGGEIRFFEQTDVIPLATGARFDRNFYVFGGGVPLKVTLVWTDPPGSAGSLAPLVNDLDLTLIAPSGTLYRGNQFTGGWSTPDPGPGTDTANNVENVYVQTPEPGTWALRVASALTTTNPPGLSGQDFALVYSGDAADCARPDAPTSLVASIPAANRVDLAWNPSPSAVSYKVLRSVTSGGPYTELADVGATSYSDLTVSGGTTYYYVVEAVGPVGCTSLPSNESVVMATGDCLLAPSFAGLQSLSSLAGICSIELGWTPATSNCPGAAPVYNVYRSVTQGFVPGPANLLDSCVTGSSYEDTNVTSGTNYYYIVRAEDAGVSGAGPCNGGNVESNLVEKGGATGATPTVLYSNDFESADDFLHAVDVAGKADSWRGIQTSCPASSGTGIYRFGGVACNANYSTDALASAGPSAAVSVPAGSFDTLLRFAHRFEFEQGTSVFDGGFLSASVDGSAFQPVLGSSLSGTGYNGALDGVCSNALGTPVFTGTSAGYAAGSYVTTTVDLDAVCDGVTGGTSGCAGHDVAFRFTASTDCGTNLDGWFIDDVVVTVDVAGSCTAAPEPVSFFTVTSTDQKNELEWLNPASGGTVQVVYRTDRLPTGLSDGTPLTPPSGTPGAHQSFVHQPLGNGTTYYYGMFVTNLPAVSAGRFASGRPVAPGPVQWVYNTGATALAPPSIGSVYAVSNDRILHSMVRGSPGGVWPSGWVPLALNVPSQSRAPVIGATVGSASKVAFVGAHDGRVHAVDAITGAELWSSPLLGERIAGSPSGIFTAFLGAYDLIFAGTRNSSSDNELVALRLADGMKAWSFDNGGGANAIGIIGGSTAVDYQNKRLYFASRSPAGGSANTLWCLEFTDLAPTLLWARALGDIDGSPILWAGRVYVGTNGSKVYSVDAATGADLWAAPFDASNGPVKGFIWPGFGRNEVYFATSTTIWGLFDNGSSAAEKWRVTSVASPSTPLLAPGTPYLYVGGGNGTLHRLDVTATPPTSTVLVLGAGNAAAGPPSLDVVHGLLYVGTTSGAIYAVSLAIP